MATHGLHVHVDAADEPLRGAPMLVRVEPRLPRGRRTSPWTAHAAHSRPRWFWLLLAMMFLPGIVTAAERLRALLAG